MTDPQLPAGWFPDPLGRYDHRWFNGTSWTSDVSSNGQRFVDPLGLSPNPFEPPGDGRNRAATAAMVCGLVAMGVAWIPFLVVAGAVLAVLAIVFGANGLRGSRSSGVGRGRAIAGLVTGIAAIGLAVIGAILTVDVFREVIDYIEPGPRIVEDVECSLDGRDATVTGTITNLDDERHDYTIFVEVGGRTGYDEIEGVDPDEPVEWQVVVRTPNELSACDPTVTVNGPFPYGIETDPYRD